MDDSQPSNPAELLQVTITVAGFAIALVAFDPRGAVAPYLLVAGLMSLGGSGHALAAMWQDAGLSWRALVTLRLSLHEAALVYTVWGMLMLGIAYIALGFDTFIL